MAPLFVKAPCTSISQDADGLVLSRLCVTQAKWNPKSWCNQQKLPIQLKPTGVGWVTDGLMTSTSYENIGDVEVELVPTSSHWIDSFLTSPPYPALVSSTAINSRLSFQRRANTVAQIEAETVTQAWKVQQEVNDEIELFWSTTFPLNNRLAKHVCVLGKC